MKREKVGAFFGGIGSAFVKAGAIVTAPVMKVIPGQNKDFDAEEEKKVEAADPYASSG